MYYILSQLKLSSLIIFNKEELQSTIRKQESELMEKEDKIKCLEDYIKNLEGK